MMYIMVVLVVSIISFVLGLKYSEAEILKIKKFSSKHWMMFQLLCKWIKEEDKIVRFISAGRYEKIGIYGMSYIGDCLADVLTKAGYQHVYGIDRNADKLYNSHVTIYNPDDMIPEADLVIITTVFSDDRLNEFLQERFGRNTDIISLENILY